jgi:hypothetical protein
MQFIGAQIVIFVLALAWHTQLSSGRISDPGAPAPARMAAEAVWSDGAVGRPYR